MSGPREERSLPTGSEPSVDYARDDNSGRMRGQGPPSEEGGYRRRWARDDDEDKTGTIYRAPTRDAHVRNAHMVERRGKPAATWHARIGIRPPKRLRKQRLPPASICEKNMERQSQEMRVLAVDDSPISRKLIEYALKEKAYKVLYAKEGREAMKLFAEHPADLVITDWEMADMSGPELCRRIRAEFPAAYTYLLLLTSNSDKKSLAEGLAAGADDYLTKPFDRDELIARVGVGVRVVEMHRAIEANNKRLLVEARTEPLTRLPNRRAFEEWATKQVAGAMRHGYPISVILADLDSHKELGDRFGHAAGDAALKLFADVLRENTRVSDMSGHFGGNQFVLLVTHVEKDGVQVLLGRLRERLAAKKVDFKRASAPLTASFGVARSEEGKQTDLASLLAQADAALVEAKRVAQTSFALR